MVQAAKAVPAEEVLVVLAESSRARVVADNTPKKMASKVLKLEAQAKNSKCFAAKEA